MIYFDLNQIKETCKFEWLLNTKLEFWQNWNFTPTQRKESHTNLRPNGEFPDFSKQPGKHPANWFQNFLSR